MLRTLLSTSILIFALTASPALAIDGLAPAGPCAEEETPVTGPVAKLFSPMNVASAGAAPSLSINLPLSQGFRGPSACDTAGGCGGLNALPVPRMTPPVNPPGDGEPPEYDKES
jgi:hypothetical protein